MHCSSPLLLLRVQVWLCWSAFPQNIFFHINISLLMPGYIFEVKDTPNLHFEWLSYQISKQGIFCSLHTIQLLNILIINSMFQETTLQGFQMPCWIPSVLLTNERTNSAWNINASPVTSSGFHFIIAGKLPDKGRRHHTSVNISPRYVHIWNVTGNYSGANTILFTWISSIDSTSSLLFTSPIFYHKGYFQWSLSSYILLF